MLRAKRLLSSFSMTALGCALFAAACAGLPDRTASEALPPGTTLHYLRSNQDGSKPEHVHVHIAAPNEIAVMKRIAPCTDAALVTARFDIKAGEAVAMTGGRLGRNGEQVPQAFLTFNTEPRTLDIRFGDPDKEIALSAKAPPAPWRMYDFDLAEFALFGPRGGDMSSNLSFGFAMTWPGDDAPPFQILGPVAARYSGEYIEGHMETVARAYDLTGPGLTGGGTIQFNARHGYVEAAEIARPNHPGYADFRLELLDIQTGEAAWQELLDSHWRDCPPPTNPAEPSR